eukprot:SAG31_NODE_38394_length_296_cov_1.055838_2_plen_65_part_01
MVAVVCPFVKAEGKAHSNPIFTIAAAHISSTEVHAEAVCATAVTSVLQQISRLREDTDGDAAAHR